MALNYNIPKSARLAVVGGIFKAVLNNPTIGKYDFTNYAPAGSRYNVAIPLGLGLNPNYLYFFHQMGFSLSCDEGTFLSAIEPDTVPEIKIRDSTTNKSIFHAPFRLSRYFENSAVDQFFFNMNSNAVLIADFQAILQVVPALIGVSDLYGQVSFSIYEITDQRYISEYKKEAKV